MIKKGDIFYNVLDVCRNIYDRRITFTYQTNSYALIEGTSFFTETESPMFIKKIFINVLIHKNYVYWVFTD